MLFALWSENRATEDPEGNLDQARRSASLRSVSRHDSITPADPDHINPMDQKDVVVDQQLEKDIEKDAKTSIETSRADPVFDEGRPAIFKSTFFEVLCVCSLVSAQLTNVRSLGNLSFIHNRNSLMPKTLQFLL
jgi:hypothetical protein